MPITNLQSEYNRLRSFLNPYISGPNTDAVLSALATSSSYLINNVAAVNENLYIATAIQQYLDLRLSEFGITRPSNIGLSDEIFSEIGIAVKNRKQVRDLMNQILDSIFGDAFVRANSTSGTVEPYALQDGDTLIVNFDSNHTATVIFSEADFQNISHALAQEVADSITTSLRNLGYSGTAIVKSNSNGNYVQLMSDTIGPKSSVTVLGGRSQNEFQFSSIVPTTGNASTQWTLTKGDDGTIRFTWTGGSNPNVGKVSSGDYVNIFGGGFSSSPNSGTYTVTNVVGGAQGSAFFEVINPLGTTGIVVQGSSDAVLFYNPIRTTIASNQYYAAVYQAQPSILQIFLPATTQVIRRSREGSAHLHYDPQGNFVLSAQPANGDVFSITTSNALIAGTNFVIGATVGDTAANLAAAINTIPNLLSIVGDQFADVTTGSVVPGDNVVNIVSNDPSITLVVSYTGSQNISASGPLGDNTSLHPGQQGPYAFDLSQPFTVSSVTTTLTQELDATKPRVFTVTDSSHFPNSQGYLILGYGTAEQEGPVPYIGTPSGDTILISPYYTVQNVHQVGSPVNLVAQKSPVSLTQDGTDFPFYITDVVSGREYAETLIQSVAATGISIIFTILYPSDIGLGKWNTQYSEIPIIYGP